MRLRLTNSGNRAVFYPVNNGTQNPVGKSSQRNSSSSEWTTMSDALARGLSRGREIGDTSIAWVEMPPGGWADGEFLDAGDAPGEHAYAIPLKATREATPVRMVSNSYTFPPHQL